MYTTFANPKTDEQLCEVTPGQLGISTFAHFRRWRACISWRCLLRWGSPSMAGRCLRTPGRFSAAPGGILPDDFASRMFFALLNAGIVRICADHVLGAV